MGWVFFYSWQTTVKVYARCLRPDIEYKTLVISYQTTCKEMVMMLLNKAKMKHRDPKLFYLTMEVGVRKSGKLFLRVCVCLCVFLFRSAIRPYKSWQFCHRLSLAGWLAMDMKGASREFMLLLYVQYPAATIKCLIDY